MAILKGTKNKISVWRQAFPFLLYSKGPISPLPSMGAEKGGLVARLFAIDDLKNWTIFCIN